MCENKKGSGPTPDAHDNTTGALELIYVHDTFKPKFFEVKPIRLVEVCGDGFGIVIDHDRLLAHVPKFPRAGDGAPVEFNTAPNTVDPTAQDDSTIVVELDVVL